MLLAPYVAAKDLGRLQNAWGKTLIEANQRAAYVSLQAAIPDGERLLVMTDQPFAFDYTRQEILNIDAPGVVSPDPGMPFFQGTEVLKHYLRSQSIRYVAFKDFDRAIGCGHSRYNRAMWEYHKTGPHPLWRVYLNMFPRLAADTILIGPHHASAELVENAEGRLIARQAKLSLKLNRRDAGRLAGDQISRPKPCAQRHMAAFHDGANRQAVSWRHLRQRRTPGRVAMRKGSPAAWQCGQTKPSPHRAFSM